jgi:MFS family permease
MDSFIYALVLVPALRDLLPHSGIPATPGATGYYGGLIFAAFLVGWGLSFVWGPVADHFGRVLTLALTIVCYSLFTFLGAVAKNVWMLAAFRLLAGIGIGGEWTLGSTFIAEALPDRRRAMGAGVLTGGFYLGMFFAALVNHTVGSRFGWRAVFAVGGAPILLAIYTRYAVAEPQRWSERKLSTGRSQSFVRPLLNLFSERYRARTLLNMVYLQVSIIGLWAGSVYAPTAVRYLAGRAGFNLLDGGRIASSATMLLAAGTILGCVTAPLLAERIGRRAALGIYYGVMLLSISGAFGGAFYLMNHALSLFIASLFFLGFGGGTFGIYTLWLPEQYPTECRATAFGFITSIGRFGGAAVTSLVGLGVAHFGTLGKPVALTSVAFLAGLLLLPFGAETTGKQLPS